VQRLAQQTAQKGGFTVHHASKKQEEGPMSEIEIVNAFTKLIFGEDIYSARELCIVEALQTLNTGFLCDSRNAAGEYLRNLGVREMIELVSGLQEWLADCSESAISNRQRTNPATDIFLRS